MFNAHDLFMTRFRAFVKETSRYFQYIFNGHTAIAILFLISAAAYYYQHLLRTLPVDFPTSWVIAFFFSLVSTYSPIHTLLKEADLVFLLPAEQQMGRYFTNALIFSYVLQLYLVVLILAVLAPLYQASFDTYSGYLFYGVILVILKAWNMMANWWMLKIRDQASHIIEKGCRFLLQLSLFYFFVNGHVIFAAITTVLLFVVFLYSYYLASRHKALAWDRLVEKDQSQMRAFYRLANMFTDVPHLKARIKKRHWLVHLATTLVPFKQRTTFSYLYRITFIRSSDYLGIYLRLTGLGFVAILYIPQLWLGVAIGILFLYLSGIQLMTISQHHRLTLWMDIYPIANTIRYQAVHQLLLQLLSIQTVLLTLAFCFVQDFFGAMVMLVAGSLFNLLFCSLYIRKKVS